MSMMKFLTQIAAFKSYPEAFVKKQQEKYGSPFFLPMTPKNGIWVSGTAEAAKAIFSLQPEMFTNLQPSDPLQIIVGTNSLILAGGHTHLCEKRAMVPFFHGSNITVHGEIMRSHTLTAIKDWRSGMRVDLTSTMRNITLDIILSAIFGVDNDPTQLATFRHETLKLLNYYSPSLMFIPLLRNRYWSPWKKFLQARKALDNLLLQNIACARQSAQKDKSDILTKLATLILPNGSQWNSQQLLDQLRTLLIAGHETSSTALSWALFYILSHPEIYAKLLAELQSNESLSIEKIIKMPYLTAVCQEALRIHPVVPLIVRTLHQPYEFEGKLLNPGDNIGLSITLLHSDSNIWQKPDIFYPDRFIDNKFSNHEYVPFGGGTKRCLGASFAMYEMKIILATILLNKKVSIIPSITTPCLQGLTMGPRRPIFGIVS